MFYDVYAGNGEGRRGLIASRAYAGGVTGVSEHPLSNYHTRHPLNRGSIL